MKRDAVIKQVADTVGAPHTVDLMKYDLLVIVEFYKVSRHSVVDDLILTSATLEHLWHERCRQ